MKITNSFILIFSLIVTSAFGQLSKQEQKKLKKIKKQYDFVSIDKYRIDDKFKCDNIFVGDYIYGVNDGGGAPRNAIKNLKLITIDNKLVKEIKDYIIISSTGRSSEKYKNLIRIESTRNGLMGIMTNCGEIILQPKYNYINSGFNNEGHAVAFLGNTIDILDSKGNSVLKQKLFYDVKYQNSRTYPLDKNVYSLKVIDGNIIAKKELNGKYGIYNISEGEFISELKYSEIDINPIRLNQSNYFKVKYDGKFSLFNVNTKTELIPNIFSEIKDLSEKYVIGNTKDFMTEKSANFNWYDLETKKFVFPTGIESYRLQPIKDFPDLWIANVSFTKDGEKKLGNSIYDTSINKFLIEPNDNYERISQTGFFKTLEVSVKNSNNKLFFSLEKRKFLELEISNKKLSGGIYPKRIILKNSNDKKEIYFMIYLIQPNKDFRGSYHVIYDREWNEIFKGLINSDKVIDNVLAFKKVEYENGLKYYTPMKIDREGNILKE